MLSRSSCTGSNSHHVYFQCEHAAVVLEVLIGRENLPVAEFRDCAKQKVNCRAGDAAATAAVVHGGSSFIIGGGERGIIEGAQIVPQLFEALLVANARQQLLAHPRSVAPGHRGPAPRALGLATARAGSGLPICGAEPETIWECPPAPALAGTPPLRLVVVSGIKIEGPECIEDALLLAPFDVLGESGGDGLLFSAVMAGFLGGGDQLVVQGQVGWHV
jgi:hypothetical protein